MSEGCTRPASHLPQITRLILTREFSRGFTRLTPAARRRCERALKRLLETPRGPAVRLRPLISPAGYFELRVGYRDRVTLRVEGPAAILLGVISFTEVARSNARVSRYLGQRRSS